MTRGWSAHGARCRGALALLEQFEAEGRRVWADQEGKLVIDPADDLVAGDFHILRDLKPELLAWVFFTQHQRSLIASHDPDLVDLKHYREGLEIWLRFTREEQSRMVGFPWTVADLRAIAELKGVTGGTVQEVGWADQILHK